MNRLFSLIIILISFYSTKAVSQKEANIWYFGNNAGIDFNTSPPTALSNGRLDTNEGCSSFSDADGNLLFYSDGTNVYNKNHLFMRYSDGRLANNLEGNSSSTQSGMIIPKPGSSDIYYLFTVGTSIPIGGIGPNPGFNYYTIDMSVNNGLGEITEGAINLAIDPVTNMDISDSWSEKVTAVKGKDCDTFWVLSFAVDSFYAYKVDENGVDIDNVVKSSVDYISDDVRGYLQVSPDGSKIAFADHNPFESANGNIVFNGNLQLFNFNDETGIVDSTPETLISNNTNQSPYGVSFSRQSNKLYVSNLEAGFTFTLFQFDLESPNIKESSTLITTKESFRGGLQLGPDGKIYISIPESLYLDVIENPDEDAENIIYSEDAIFLNGKTATQGLPPFIASLLLPIEVFDTADNEPINNKDLQYCIGESILLESEPLTGNNIIYNWTFNDGVTTTPIGNSASLNLPNLNVTNNGTYNLLISLEDMCGNLTTFEATFNIEVFEPAIANKPLDIALCDEDGINTFDFQNNITPNVLGIQDPNQFDVLYFLTEEDAINNTNSLSNPYTNTEEFLKQDIYARIHNIDAPDACFDITTFNLSIFDEPTPSQPTNYEACDDEVNGGDTDGFFNNFILSSKDSEILGSLNPSLFNISYHTTLLGAQTSSTTDFIDKNSPYRNISNEQLIYVRVEVINNTECFVVSNNSSETFKPFSLIVNPLPIVSSINQVFLCDSNNDLTTITDLTLSEMNISNNYMNEIFTYFPTENDAINNTSEITQSSSYSVTNGDTIWVRVISDKECFRIATLNIVVSFDSLASTNFNQTITNCDDEFDNLNNDSDGDGITNFDISSVTTNILATFPNTIQNDLEVLIFETMEDRDLLTNPITNLTTYRNTNIPALTPQQLYIKVINTIDNSCNSLGEITIITNPLPDFDIQASQVFCLNRNPLTLEVENPQDTYSYEWTKDNDIDVLGREDILDINSSGEYHVTAIDNVTNCPRTKTFSIFESSIAVIDLNAITVIEDSKNNSITINEDLLNNGDYEYALLNEEETELIEDYQDEPFFDNLKGGIYTVAIQDRNSCGVITHQVSIIEFPKFLTPNNDGKNDTWNIKGINNLFYPISTINIYDRYGKNIAKIGIEEGWDGTSNGKQMPQNDYWYGVELTDQNGNKQIKKGHFSLIRN